MKAIKLYKLKDFVSLLKVIIRTRVANIFDYESFVTQNFIVIVL